MRISNTGKLIKKLLSMKEKIEHKNHLYNLLFDFFYAFITWIVTKIIVDVRITSHNFTNKKGNNFTNFCSTFKFLYNIFSMLNIVPVFHILTIKISISIYCTIKKYLKLHN